MSLTASSPVVLIPPATASGPVTIGWKYSQEIKLEERTYKAGSTPPPFQRRPIPDTQATAGSYDQTLTPGDVYEVRSFDRDFVGDEWSDERKAEWMLDEVVVHALRTSSRLQSDFNEAVGGTFYRYDIATHPTPTHAVMEIGTDQPTVDAAGFRTMANPMITVKSFQPGTMYHELTTDKVILDWPKTDQVKLTDARFALIRVSDGAGNWEQIERPVRTRERRLTIDFQQIDVQSIGEPASATEGQMRFSLEVWDDNLDGQGWKPVQTFAFAKDPVTLTPFNVRDFEPNPVVVIGPRPVRGQTAGLKLHVREFDDFPFEDEEATQLRPQRIEVKAGEFNENQTLNLSVRAYQQDVADDPLDPEEAIDVVVHVTVTVEHGP